MRSKAMELLKSVVGRCGGEEKWFKLLNAMRQICHTNDRRDIADFARRCAKKDDGAVQLVMLALLGLTLGATLLEHKDAGRSGQTN